MSVLVHLCLDCGHPASWHTPRERGYLRCRYCLQGDGRIDPEPVLRETFTSPGGRPEPLHAPGSVRNAGRMHAERLCDCSRCRAHAASLPSDALTRRVG